MMSSRTSSKIVNKSGEAGNHMKSLEENEYTANKKHNSALAGGLFGEKPSQTVSPLVSWAQRNILFSVKVQSFFFISALLNTLSQLAIAFSIDH